MIQGGLFAVDAESIDETVGNHTMINANSTEVSHLLTLNSYSNRITNQLASSDLMKINIQD